MKRFNVVIAKKDGGVEIYPMKQWLRQHPESVPAGLDATSSTSHELRNGLKKMGWSVEATENEVRLVMMPDQTISAVLGPGESEEDVDSEPMTFTLESHLQDFLAQNLGLIPVDGRRLRLFVDPAGRDGVEFQTDVGRIDILAVDDTGAFVVLELKRARSPDHTIGQLVRYMGWVKQTIGKDQQVRGIVVAEMISESLRYAVSVIPNVSLFEYEVSFQLKAVQSR